MDLMEELGILFLVCLAGEGAAALLPLPGSVLSLLLLLALLLSRRIPEARIARSSTFFVENMGIFFVPSLVGILEHGDRLRAFALPFLGITLLTTPVVYCAAAWTVQRLMARSRRKEAPHA